MTTFNASKTQFITQTLSFIAKISIFDIENNCLQKINYGIVNTAMLSKLFS